MRNATVDALLNDSFPAFADTEWRAAMPFDPP